MKGRQGEEDGAADPGPLGMRSVSDWPVAIAILCRNREKQKWKRWELGLCVPRLARRTTTSSAVAFGGRLMGPLQPYGMPPAGGPVSRRHLDIPAPVLCLLQIKFFAPDRGFLIGVSTFTT